MTLRCPSRYRVPSLAGVPEKVLRCDLPADLPHAWHVAFVDSRRAVDVDGATLAMGELRWPTASEVR